MTSPTKESPTRTKLMDAAEALMLERGYVAATVDAICEAAGVTKGSFFHYFRSKEELGKALLLRFSTRQAEQFAGACGHLEDPLERVLCTVDAAIAASQDPDMKGCLVGTLAQEISETHPELRQVCEVCFGGFSQGVTADLAAAKERHCPEASFEPKGLADYFLAIAQGSMLLMRANGDRQAMGGNLRHFRAYLQSLYGR